MSGHPINRTMSALPPNRGAKRKVRWGPADIRRYCSIYERRISTTFPESCGWDPRHRELFWAKQL